MNGKEFLLRMLSLYFALVTLITAAIFIMGSVLDPDARFGYDALLSPLVFAAAGVLPAAVMYSRRELSVRETLLRKGIQLVAVEALVLLLAGQSPAIHTEEPAITLALAGCVLLIYLAVNLFHWLLDRAAARRMTEDLCRWQSRTEP